MINAIWIRNKLTNKTSNFHSVTLNLANQNPSNGSWQKHRLHPNASTNLLNPQKRTFRHSRNGQPSELKSDMQSYAVKQP